MRKILTLVVLLFCLGLWAQVHGNGSTIVDSLYAIPELDGDMAANTSGEAFSVNTTTYVFEVGDLGYPYENCAVRAFISFPLPIIPSGYSLVNATIRLYQFSSGGIEQLEDSTYVNTFFPHWDVAGGDTIKCIVSHVDYGISLGLDDWPKGDGDNPYTYNPNVGEITWEGINEPGNGPNHHGEAGYRYLDITDCVLHDLAIGSIFSQYRIAFQINTDYDNGSDFVAFKSMESNNEHQRPLIYYTLYNPSSASDDLSPEVLVNVTSSPNPFSSQVTFDISLKNHAILSIRLYDLRGRLVKEYGSTQYTKGLHSIDMDTHDLSNGIYLLQIRAGSEMITKKITCLK
ncbi:MAG: T9SS type A sorting domain-containing protein [Candidatus Cloacimonetes bacterium]|nr:T9SS type A sorting domain-containing protein [Candidatus Cloacimonadota bacterium]MDD3234952.1 T9SS type A sorting domain-containing protein [Candidatus Cloacimonadota bacterium]